MKCSGCLPALPRPLPTPIWIQGCPTCSFRRTVTDSSTQQHAAGSAVVAPGLLARLTFHAAASLATVPLHSHTAGRYPLVKLRWAHLPGSFCTLPHMSLPPSRTCGTCCGSSVSLCRQSMRAKSDMCVRPLSAWQRRPRRGCCTDGPQRMVGSGRGLLEFAL